MDDWGLSVVTPPSTEPVTLVEAKAQLRVDTSDDDDDIEAMISAARSAAEGYTRRALWQQTLKLTLDEFPAVIRLPRPPVQSVSSIEYVDADGATQTLASSLYRLDSNSEPGRITPAWGETWPTTRHVTGAVTVTYVAGYTASNLPPAIKRAILRIISDLYDQREDTVEGEMMMVPRSAEALMAPHRSWL